jgi:hypothetical protein
MIKKNGAIAAFPARAFLLTYLFFVYSTSNCQTESLHSKAYTSSSFFPAVTLENPIGNGKLGTVIPGGTYENITRIAPQPDANAGVYIGLGDPDKLVGVGVTVNIYGLSNKTGRKNNLGEGSLSFHLNKFFLNEKLLLNAGLDNAIYWMGDQSYITAQKSFYFSANYLFTLRPEALEKSFSYVSITGGVGNGYYRRDKNYTEGASGSFDPFLSLATPVFKGINIISEWNGYDIGAGISSIPYQKIPFMFTLEISDLVFGKPRFVTSVSFPFNFNRAGKSKRNSLVRPIGIQPIRAERTI